MPPLTLPSAAEEAAGPDRKGVGALVNCVLSSNRSCAHGSASSADEHGGMRTLLEFVLTEPKQLSAREVASAQKHGEKMRRHLTGSIYLWACGERSDKDEHDITLADQLIGWLVPLVSARLR